MTKVALRSGRRTGLSVSAWSRLPLALALLLPWAAFAQQEGQPFTFETTTRLVVVNAAVQDRDGKPIEGLTAADFRVLEDGEPQKLAVFEYQRLESRPLPPAAPPPVDPANPAAPIRLDSEITPSKEGELRYRDRRLLAFYFDFSSMPAADQIRSQKAALKFLDEQMTESDLVAILVFTSDLKVVQDFTDDRELLRTVVRSFRVGEGSELSELFETDAELLEDTGEAFTADETEFNLFNTDRKLSALEQAARMLGSLPEKKALIYFSSGVGKTGVENHSQLRSTINAAVRANLSFYPVDARGLVAEAPAGDARVGNLQGTSLFSGRGQGRRREKFLDQQETLYSLAEDTGGKALLDANDLSLGIVQAQEAISSYYILGYYSSNAATDGKFRRVKVEIPSQPKAKLDYRSGYFAPKDFTNFTSADKERQLEEALLLEDPITDLTLAIELNYFRLTQDRYFVPLAVKIPGSELELAGKTGKEKTRLDFIGQVRDDHGRLLGAVRDHIEIQLDDERSKALLERQLQYDAGFALTPGDYTLKFLARENLTGKIGTFETDFTVPDLGRKSSEASLSSVVLASQREPIQEAVGGVAGKRLMRRHPLVQDGQKLIPSITRVFRRDQPLYVFFELYDPGLGPDKASTSVAAQVSFFQGATKAFESAPLRVDGFSKQRGSVGVELQLALADLAPGRYDCQVSVIDELGRKFAFRRAPIVVLPDALARPSQ
ncbi:MAG: VWA domain-containing protein [Acidobacteria bacterium]|nr:VWA domain-containing protein [Acidobacteriota bacterium]